MSIAWFWCTIWAKLGGSLTGCWDFFCLFLLGFFDIVSVFSDVIQLPNFFVSPSVHRTFSLFFTICFPQTRYYFLDTSTCLLFYSVSHLWITSVWSSLDRILKTWEFSSYYLSTAISVQTFVCFVSSPQTSTIFWISLVKRNFLH